VGNHQCGCITKLKKEKEKEKKTTLYQW
jgi:hypothetical protein